MMAVKGAEALGTGLKDVMRLLLELPAERLLSLTYQLGGAPEERLVQALSLLLLHRDTQGLDRLQALRDNSLANHLAEKWHMAGGKLADFREQCGHLDNVAAAEETLEHLARVFKVLFENRLCDPHLIELAYGRAISAFAENNNDSKVELMIDEAKGVCGPEFAEKMLQVHLQSKGGADRESAASSLSQGEGGPCTPCPLLASSSMTLSYPTHLEISLPPTDMFVSHPIKPVNSQHAPHPPDQLENHAPRSCGASHASQTSSVLTSESVWNTTACSVATTDASPPPQGEEPTAPPPPSPSKSPPAPPEGFTPQITNPIQEEAGNNTREEEEEEEEEDTFYAFVILYAAEDADVAEAMRERLESVCGGKLTGATFSEDFALPGRSSLRCIDDALENSAFTILLLTNHYCNSRRFQMEAESALINSIEHRPKYNTVIPLLPRVNGAQQAGLPRALQTLVPLQENRSFDRKVRRFLTAESVRAQRTLWSNEQKVKKELRRQERIREADRQRRMLSDVQATTARLRLARLRADPEQALYLSSLSEGASPLGPGWQGQLSNIHVNHANYVLIGNHSTMTVDLAGSNTDHVLEGEDNRF